MNSSLESGVVSLKIYLRCALILATSVRSCFLITAWTLTEQLATSLSTAEGTPLIALEQPTTPTATTITSY